MNSMVKYDPLLFKCPKGVVKIGTTVKYFIEVKDELIPNEVYFMIKADQDSDYEYHLMTKVEGGYETTINFDRFGHFWYNFKLNFNDYSVFVNKTWDCYSEVSNFKGEDFFQSVLKNEYTCTNSMQGGLIYQIFVDRFCRVGEVESREPLILRDDWGGKISKNSSDPLVINQEVFGGNIKGIISKLSYLKDLGVTVIYLNPIGMANSSHKYDTADYMTIDPMFGTEKEFKELVSKAKDLGMGIIIDGVYNHTGSDSIYFNRYGRFDTLGAYRSKESKFYKWYEFMDYPNVYMSWWGIDTLPTIKDKTGDFHNYIAGDGGVIEKFMKMGIAGVRLDVVDEYGDDFVKKIAAKVHEFGENKVVMGEVWEDASTKISYSNRRTYFAENELNSVMNYPYKESVLNFIRSKEAYELVSTTRMLQNNYPKLVLDNLMNFVDTHDTGRMFSELLKMADDDRDLATIYLKIVSLLSFTISGVPSIFYGDEYGMENNDGSSRGCFDWKNYKNEIFAWYKKLTKIRKHKAFAHGDMNILYSSYGKFVFERVDENEQIVVAVNLQKSALDLTFENEMTSLLSGEKVKTSKLKHLGFDAFVYKKK